MGTNLIAPAGTASDAYLTNYKSYVALITQEGESDPVAIVMNSNDSNYIGNITWSRLSAGSYMGNLVGAFPNAEKIAIFFGNTNGGLLLSSSFNDGDNIGIASHNLDAEGALSDDYFYLTPIEIRVYP